MQALGVDIGGSGIKGAIVENGKLVSERIRIPTPSPSTPTAVADVVATIARRLDYRGPIGCGFPAVIQHGVARTAANIDAGWIDCNVETVIQQATDCPVIVINDADAAGLAEVQFGAAQDPNGVMMMVTIGTGLGSALFRDGVLFPNTELGHLMLNNIKAEHYASGAVRKREGLSWKEWGARFNEVLELYERLFWPDLFILGGGDCKKLHKFEPCLKVRADVRAATLENQAGIIGAATAAIRHRTQK
ncbi:MAG: ROK family protein [Myxococcota bacterium]|nr:ROK family protein [Myxococcota bacterium]